MSKEIPKSPKSGTLPADIGDSEKLVTAEPRLKPPFMEVAEESYLDLFDEI